MLGPGLSCAGDSMDLKAVGALSNHETKLFKRRHQIKSWKRFRNVFSSKF